MTQLKTTPVKIDKDVYNKFNLCALRKIETIKRAKTWQDRQILANSFALELLSSGLVVGIVAGVFAKNRDNLHATISDLKQEAFEEIVLTIHAFRVDDSCDPSRGWEGIVFRNYNFYGQLRKRLKTYLYRWVNKQRRSRGGMTQLPVPDKGKRTEAPKPRPVSAQPQQPYKDEELTEDPDDTYLGLIAVGKNYSALSARDRDVFSDREIMGYTLEETARFNGLSNNGVKLIVDRVYKQLYS